ncbi:hypothetical protein TNCV_1007801 [Trichonephila clavipes]|nr:hypothetical protein TNCV_1007801 [Trichonephila clavipes]
MNSWRYIEVTTKGALHCIHRPPVRNAPPREKHAAASTITCLRLKQESFLSALRHELRNPHDPGNYSNDWLDQSAASYMLAGYSPQSF